MPPESYPTKLGWKTFKDFEEAQLAAINDANSNIRHNFQDVYSTPGKYDTE